jgi:hypothetical protein
MSLRLIAFAALAFVLLSAAPASAEPQADRIRIDYVAPTGDEHAALAKRLQDSRVLEQLKEFLSAFRLPSTVTLRLATCRSANAWYDEGTITVCYQYVDTLIRHAPDAPVADGVSRADTVVGPTLEAFLHEMAHAVFELLQIPILGREEDAADQLAAYLLLHLSKEEARRAVIGTAAMYLREARAFTATELTQFSGPHPVPAQRYYNLLCLAYGADATLFADTVAAKLLPQERAEQCAGEFKQVTHAFRALIAPHLDHARLQQLRERRWLDFEAAQFDGHTTARSKTN